MFNFSTLQFPLIEELFHKPLSVLEFCEKKNELKNRTIESFLNNTDPGILYFHKTKNKENNEKILVFIRPGTNYCSSVRLRLKQKKKRKSLVIA